MKEQEFKPVRYGIDGKELDASLTLWEKIKYFLIFLAISPIVFSYIGGREP